MSYRLGVDVGGTFTDLFLVSEGNGGARFRVKTPSTPHDPSEGVLTGVSRICEEAGIDVSDLVLAYGDHRGDPALREQIAAVTGDGVGPEHVIATPGAAAPPSRVRVAWICRCAQGPGRCWRRRPSRSSLAARRRRRRIAATWSVCVKSLRRQHGWPSRLGSICCCSTWPTATCFRASYRR